MCECLIPHLLLFPSTDVKVHRRTAVKVPPTFSAGSALWATRRWGAVIRSSKARIQPFWNFWKPFLNLQLTSPIYSLLRLRHHVFGPSMCQHCESKVFGQTRWICTDGHRHCSKKCVLDNGCELSDERIAKNVSSEIMLLTLNLFVSLLLTQLHSFSFHSFLLLQQKLQKYNSNLKIITKRSLKLEEMKMSYQVMGTWIYCWLYYIRG